MIIVFETSKSSQSEADESFQAEACSVQMVRDFAPAWGLEPWPCQSMKTLPPDVSDLHPIYTKDKLDVDGALGYHDDAGGEIYGQDMTPVDPTDAATKSHEAMEMRADPTCDQWGATMADGYRYALEVGDPVEADAYEVDVTLDGETRKMLVSNFVLPSYFQPGSQGPWDFMGRLDGPAPAMTPGGYLIRQNPTSGEISQVFADRAGARRFALKRAIGGSRAARRLAK